MENNPIKDMVVDLVTLAIKANDVVIQGQFPGSVSDEVNALLKMCQDIHNEYTNVEEEYVNEDD